MIPIMIPIMMGLEGKLPTTLIQPESFVQSELERESRGGGPRVLWDQTQSR